MEPVTVDLPSIDPVPVKCGQTKNITVKLPGEFEVSFAIDPTSAECQDDKFILYSTDEENSYYQEKTPKDNVSKEAGETKIRFTGLKKSLSYSLGVDPGKEGEPYLVFEDLAYGAWESGPVDPDMKVEFKMRFDVDPNEKNSSDEQFILTSTDAAQTIKQIKTIKDDLTQGDDTVEILFDNLDRSLSYSLQVDPGAEGELYYIFENRPYNELSKGNTE
ncbi:MAG: hypothetical protein JW863_21900 [Chitinispirillaceae bacterium]|nr:hypothetical protein [Chitinispirillaceae bacterium]